MRITHHNIRPIFFIGFVVREKHWSQTNEKVKPPKEGESDNNYTVINERISLFRRNAETAIGKALADGIPITIAYLKNAIINPTGKETHSKKTFFELLDEYIASSKAIRAKRTITGYGTFKGFLEKYEKEMHHKVDIHSINFKFFDSLRTYAYKNKQVKDNYFAKIIRNLKAFMSWCQKRGYVKDQTYKDFKAAEKEKDVIYLTIEELMTLMDFDFKLKARCIARDLYCFMCLTGLRVSDIKSLKREHIRDGQIFKPIVKTRQTEVIPLNQFASTILSRYENLEGTPLPDLSPQKLNKHIKDCCEEAGIKSLVTYVDYSGGQATEKTAPKHSLITNHTARKTFITNSIVLGMNTKAIKDITGHKKDNVFNKYIKISEDFKKLEMERTWDNIQVKTKEQGPL